MHFFVSLYTIFISPPCSCKFLRYYVSNLISWKIFVNDFSSMVKIPLSYKFILFFNKLHFLHNVFSFSIPYLHSYSMIFFLCLFLFIFFPVFSSFLFCPLFLFLFTSFPPNLHNFLNLVCHFLRAPLPCSRTFCCPENRNSLF